MPDLQPFAERSPARATIMGTAGHGRPPMAVLEAVTARWGAIIDFESHGPTHEHSARVADLACTLAVADGLKGRALEWFRVGALLHDIGKLILPPALLNKPDALTAREWELLRMHPEVGVAMLCDFELPWDVTRIVQSHHEWWNGAGYPNGLAGEDIPRVARIVGIADAYDALTSARCYRPAVPHHRALDVMRAESGRQFDPELFVRFEAVMAVARPQPRGHRQA